MVLTGTEIKSVRAARTNLATALPKQKMGSLAEQCSYRPQGRGVISELELNANVNSHP